jgi:hypothetical protein
MIYGELGLFPIEIDVKLRMISYWTRLLTGKETKLSYLSPHISEPYSNIGFTILLKSSSWLSIDKLCVLPLFKTSNIAFVAFSE